VTQRFEAAVEHWQLRDPRPLDGGCIALVCEAGSAVLKLNPRGHRDDAQLTGEGDALAFWEPTGAVPRLLGTRDEGFTLLMERLEPGTPLNETGVGWEEQLDLLGGLAATLHARAGPGDEFISMSEFCTDWDSAELKRLTEPVDDDVLVHADLHGGNVLLHGAELRVIDPKGVRGDRHADIWALLEPDAPPLPPDPQAAARTAWSWVTRYADAAGMDAQRAAAWTRVRAAAEAIWITDEAWAARLRALSAALSRTPPAPAASSA
jgi:streptomycin 6-kinase